MDTAQPKDMFSDSQRGENTLDMTPRFLQERALKIARNVQHESATTDYKLVDYCGKVKWSSRLTCHPCIVPGLSPPRPASGGNREEHDENACLQALLLGYTKVVSYSLSLFNPIRPSSICHLPFGMNCFFFFLFSQEQLESCKSYRFSEYTLAKVFVMAAPVLLSRAATPLGPGAQGCVSPTVFPAVFRFCPFDFCSSTVYTGVLAPLRLLQGQLCTQICASFRGS